MTIDYTDRIAEIDGYPSELRKLIPDTRSAFGAPSRSIGMI